MSNIKLAIFDMAGTTVQDEREVERYSLRSSISCKCKCTLQHWLSIWSTQGTRTPYFSA